MYEPTTPIKLAGLPSRWTLLLMSKDGSLGLKEMRLSPTSIAVAASNKPINSLIRRCPVGSRYANKLRLMDTEVYRINGQERSLGGISDFGSRISDFEAETHGFPHSEFRNPKFLPKSPPECREYHNAETNAVVHEREGVVGCQIAKQKGDRGVP